MSLGRINGPMLQTNLERQGVNIALDANLTYWDVNNRYVGINTTTPNYTLEVRGNVRAGNVYMLGNSISTDSGVLSLGSPSNISISGGSLDYILTTDGSGNLSWASAQTIISTTGLTGNVISLGANTVQTLVSNAVTLTQSTSVTDAVAQLNNVLGKLVPASPPNFPGNAASSVGGTSTFSITTSTSSGIMTGDSARGTGWTQRNNISGNTYQIAGGTTFSAIRSNVYATSTIAAIKSGTGNARVWLGGNIMAGYVVLTGSSGTTTNGNLTVTNDTDYHSIVSSVAAGFWNSANISASGSNQLPGWNTVLLEDFGGYTTGNTTSLMWYNDISATAAGTPTFSNTSATLTTNVVTYSSTIPHFTSGTIFRLKGNVTNLSGETYFSNTALSSTTTAAGAFQAPTAVPYAGSFTSAGYWAGTVPLPKYLANPTYGSGTSVYYETNASILASGFGNSNTGPSVTVNNNYTSASSAHAPGVYILYKNGTGTAIDETTIATTTPIGAVSGGSYRVVYAQSTDTPTAITGSETVWNSTTTPLGLMDATVVGYGTGGRVQFDQTNYSTGFLPIGPNLSGQNSTQYFTIRFAQAGVTTFYLNYTGIVSGIYCAMPGTGGTNGTNVSNGTWNGWLSAGILNPGGVPGPGSAGNGSAGCVTGTVPTFGSLVTSGTGSGKMQIYFGTTNSTTATNNMIYIRFKLTPGQYISALSITAT